MSSFWSSNLGLFGRIPLNGCVRKQDRRKKKEEEKTEKKETKFVIKKTHSYVRRPSHLACIHSRVLCWAKAIDVWRNAEFRREPRLQPLALKRFLERVTPQKSGLGKLRKKNVCSLQSAVIVPWMKSQPRQKLKNLL